MIRWVLVLVAGSCAFADEVLLHSGGKLLGVVREEGEMVIVETAYGSVSVHRDQVVAIDKTKRSKIEEYKSKESSTDLDQSAAVWDLARWARDNGLPRQARKLLQRLIELEPDHEFARRELGYHLFQGQWLTYDEMMAAKGFVKHHGKWMTASERELAAKAEQEEKARKEEERRKKEEARRAKEGAAAQGPTPAPPPPVGLSRPSVDERFPPPLSSSVYRSYNSYSLGLGLGLAQSGGFYSYGDFVTSPFFWSPYSYRPYPYPWWGLGQSPRR